MEIEQKFLVPHNFEIPENWKAVDFSQQLNHYFDSSPVSIRTRYDSSTGFEIVNKWTDDGKDSHNGTQRHELNLRVTPTLNFNEMEVVEVTEGLSLESAKYVLENHVDKILLNTGLNYLSKWSRIRKTYRYENFIISEEVNAGYGKIIEIESANNSKVNIFTILEYGKSLGLKVLESDLLNKMFKFYNEHWEEYYMTDKVIFNDERFNFE